MLDAGAQMDYLSATVNSYAYDQNETLAQARFANLGDGRNAVLAALYAAEPERAAEIENFAAAMGASDALTAPAATESLEPTEESAAGQTTEAAGGITPLIGQLTSQPFLTLGAICLGLVFIVALILLIIVSRRRRQKRGAEAIQTEQPRNRPPAETFQGFESLATTPETEPDETKSVDQSLPDWLEVSETAEAYQTVPLGESDLAGSGSVQETAQAPTIEESFEELPVSIDEELTDDDIAAITSQDFSSSGSTITGAAVFGETVAREGIHFPGSTGEPDFEEFETDAGRWLETPQEKVETEAGETFGWFESAEIDEPLEILPATPLVADETPQQTEDKFSQDIETISEITPDEAAQLRSVGVNIPLLLLRRGATLDSRHKLAQESGVNEDRLLHWVKFVDLYRIKGVDQINAELLNAAGIEGVSALASSNPTMLYQKVHDAIGEKQSNRRIASLEVIEAWIEQAKKLPHAVIE
jgi:hypothetical protein